MINKNDLREEIEIFTQFIRTRLELSSPLDMVDVVKKLGVTCTPVEEVPYDARIFSKDDLYVIEYDKDQIYERRQFSIAHELGHFLLHILNKDDTPQNVYYRRNGNSSAIEWEANEFAASLLMPRDEFRNFCMDNVDIDGKVDLSKIANFFGVSKQAARVRGSVLGLWII